MLQIKKTNCVLKNFDSDITEVKIDPCLELLHRETITLLPIVLLTYYNISNRNLEVVSD